MSPKEVAGAIQAFLDGTGGRWDWDDFISVPIGDDYLDGIRLRCASLDEEFPPGRTGEYCSEDGYTREFVNDLYRKADYRQPEEL